MKVVLFAEQSIIADQLFLAWQGSQNELSTTNLVQTANVQELSTLSADLVVLVSDSPNTEFYDAALQACRTLELPVLPVRGNSSMAFVGPLESPGQIGCISCLQFRWDHTMKQGFLKEALSRELKEAKQVHTPLAMTPNEIAPLVELVLHEVEEIAASGDVQTQGKVALCQRDGRVEWANLIPSHNCPRCNIITDDAPEYAELNFESHIIEDMESLRVHSVDFDHLNNLYVHNQVGYISSLQEITTEDNYIRASAHIRTSSGKPHVGYGAGFTPSEAKLKAMLEVVERVCSITPTHRRPAIHATYEEVQDKAIHPREFGLHGPEFYETRDAFIPYNEEQKYAWSWAYSTKLKQPILVPEQIAYYGRTTHGEKRFVAESTSGCSLGGTLEEAILHGLFEVVERDGFLNTWYGKMPVPQLTMGENCPEKVHRAIRMLNYQGFEVRLYNISHDHNIPNIFAIAINQQDNTPKVVGGTACHLNAYEAVYDAIRELTVQVLRLLGISDKDKQRGVEMFHDPSKVKLISDHVIAAGVPEAFSRWDFLLNQGDQTTYQGIEDVYRDTPEQFQMKSRDIRTILNAVLEDFHERGFDVIVVNQTNVEAAEGGFRAVKVMVPGLTPITFGYGFRRLVGLRRVFEQPCKLGYVDHMLTIEELNDECHPLT